MRLLYVWLSLGLLLLGGCMKPSDVELDDSEAETPAQMDARVATEVGKYPEARQWLSGANHVIFEISKEDASKLVETLYAAGAVKVYVSDAGEVIDGSDKEVAATLMVELPTDKAKRKKVFAAEADWWREAGEEGTKDEGQKYLEIFTD